MIMRNPPWKQIQARVAFQSQYLMVRNDVVRQPDGKRGIYAYTDKMKGVGVVVMDSRKRVYLVEEYKYPVRAYGLHLPSGGVEHGETPLAAAKRELQEETGIVAKKWQTLGRLATSDGSSAEIAHLFLASDIVVGKRKTIPLEPMKIVQMPLKKAVQMVLDGRITCSYAVTGIVRAAAKLMVLNL